MEKPVVQVVIGVIENEGRVVCVRQAEEKVSDVDINGAGNKDFLQGLWHLPGGKVEPGEELVAAMTREALEEAGVVVTIIALLGERVEEREKAILHIHWFHCSTQNSDVSIGSDAVEGMFVERSLVPGYCAEAVVAQWPERVRDYFGISSQNTEQ